MFWKKFETLCFQRSTKPNPVGKEIGISSGIITKWKNGAIPNGDSLLKLANYFDCSIDYLLDRTDEPQSHKTKSSNSVNGNYNAVDNSSVTVNNSPLDEHQKTLLDIYNKLTPIQQAQLLVEADKMAEK